MGCETPFPRLLPYRNFEADSMMTEVRIYLDDQYYSKIEVVGNVRYHGKCTQ